MPSLVKSTPLGVVTVRQYLPLCWVRTAPEVSEEEGSYASRFYRWFFTKLFFTSHGFARFNWHSFSQFPAWRFLLWLSLTWLQRYLIQKKFLSIPSLTWTLALHFLSCSVRRSLYGEENKHTHTHTHTHTLYILLHTLLTNNGLCHWYNVCSNLCKHFYFRFRSKTHLFIH